MDGDTMRSGYATAASEGTGMATTDEEDLLAAFSDLDEALEVVFRRGRNAEARQPSRRTARRSARPFTTETAVATVQLANEVEELRRRKEELMAVHFTRLLNSGRRDFLVTTVLEYYDTFRSGFLAPRYPDIFQYLNSRIDGETFAYGGGGHGRDTLLEQWSRYTRIFPNISIRVRATTCTHFVDPSTCLDPAMTTCLVEARGVMEGIISRDAIRTILPHLSARPDLVAKLLDKPLDCPINLRFHFNGSGRVVRLDLDVDYFQAFRNVEGVGLVDLVQIMEHAAVGENSIVPAILDEA